MSDQHLVIGLLYLAAAIFFALWRSEVHRRKVILRQLMERLDRIQKIRLRGREIVAALRACEAEESNPRDGV